MIANQSAVTAAPSEPVNCTSARTPEAVVAIAGILALDDFERFVFVISVLERYSDQDCSVLLGCSRQDVRKTRMRALPHVAEALVSRQYGFKHMNGQGQSYQRTASCAI